MQKDVSIISFSMMRDLYSTKSKRSWLLDKTTNLSLRTLINKKSSSMTNQIKVSININAV